MENREKSQEIPVYGSEEVKLFGERSKKLKNAFFDPTIGKFLETKAPGKRILDIGCGTGNWCCEAAQYGAVSVEGFDKEEKMVEAAKQATSQFNAVNIQLADVMNMPYNDNTFDIALSIYITSELPVEKLSIHFSELHRVLVPGGQALVVNHSSPSFYRMYLMSGANEEVVQKKIDQILPHIPDHPTRQQVSKAFEDLREVVRLCFACNKNGSLFQVKDENQLVIGQRVFLKSLVLTFSDYYYSDQFLVDQTRAAGLRIDKIENVYTEERRLVQNIQNPDTPYSKDVIDYPFCLLYHISKPID